MTNQPEFNKQHWGEKKIADCIYELNKYNSTLRAIRCKNAKYTTSFDIRKAQALVDLGCQLSDEILCASNLSAKMRLINKFKSQARLIHQQTQFKPDYIVNVKGGKK